MFQIKRIVVKNIKKTKGSKDLIKSIIIELNKIK